MFTVINHIKEEKRRLFRAKIQQKQLEKIAFEQSSRQLSKLLSQLNIWKKGLVVASYRPLPGELSPEFFQRKYQQKCRFVFPQIKKTTYEIRFVSASLDREEDWEQSPWPGGWQPTNEMEISLHKIDVFFVPALAFDREGRRLGRGGGFYDRALSQASGIKMGLASACQISNEALPEESHDVKMDAVLTDDFLIVPLKHTRIFNIKGSEKEDFKGYTDC